MKHLLLFTFVCTLAISCHKADTGELNIKITAPTAFLPANADGNSNSKAYCVDGEPNCNKVFRVSISHPDGIPINSELQIVDQKGVLLYTGKDRREGWNGRKYNKGYLAPQGTYIYRIKATNPNTGDFKTQQGEFVLLR